MLGPKSSGPPARLMAGSGGCSNSLRKPVAAGASSRLGAASCSTTSATASGNRAQSSTTLRQASQASLLASSSRNNSSIFGVSKHRSTSRCSITSDTTTASVCSSSSPGSRINGPQQSQIKGKSLKLSSSAIPTTKTTTARAGAAGSTTAPTRFKSGPSSTASSLSSSTTAVSSSGPTGLAASASSAAAARRVPTLAMSLRDKDQQIKLLIKERDEQKFQAELMARRAEQWEEKFMQSELEKSHVTSEADDEVVELRRLTQELEDENKRLAESLAIGEQAVGDTQFKLDELEIESKELRKSLEEREEQLATMEQEQRELVAGAKTPTQVTTERAISKAKYEREIELLKEKITSRDEQMIQLRSSLEMRKNEVTNLQSVAGDLERKLKIESERSERHLKRIDEINLELKASEAKLATKSEENEIYEKQVKQLRQDLRTAEEKLEQISLARKKDVDILHNKLSAARRGSTTPTSPQPYKTPTPQDEIVRLQMELRDLKDQLIDREAELDCNRRDIEVMRRKMETRTLEVDCNNQELARRCQDLLEQNRQSEDTVKQLLRSTTEHSAQLMRATEDLKEANGKCIKLRDEINELETKLDDEMRKSNSLFKENGQIKEENEELREQVDLLRQQVASLNRQLSDLCEQLDVQTDNLHKDREALANQLSQNEIDLAQLRHDLATAKQDLRSSKLQTQEVLSERDRLKADLSMKEKYIRSRNDIIETMRHELDDCKKSLAEHKQKIEELRLTSQTESEQISRDLKAQLESLKRELQIKSEECALLRLKSEQLQKSLDENRTDNEKEREDELRKFDEMRQKHSAELDTLKEKLQDLEEQLEDAKSSTLKRDNNKSFSEAVIVKSSGSQGTTTTTATVEKHQSKAGSAISKQRKEDYETQIEFLNSVVVDMQRKCDDYKNRLAQVETMQIMNEFDNLILSNQPTFSSRASTLRRNNSSTSNGLTEIKAAPSAAAPPPPPAPSSPPPALDQAPVPAPAPILAFASTTLVSPNNHSVHFENGLIDKPPTRISGRPFCDICNVYDLHHTVYCRKVSEKLASRRQQQSIEGGNSNNNNNNYNNNNCDTPNVDELFREYEQSIETNRHQFASLRRLQGAEKPPRPYCDHCDLFGHTIKSCNSLKA